MLVFVLFCFFVGKNFSGNLGTEVLRNERQNKIFICRFIFSFLYAFYSSCPVFTGSIHVYCKKGFDSSSLFHCPSLSFTPYQQQALFCHKNKTRYMTCFHVYDFTICKWRLNGESEKNVFQATEQSLVNLFEFIIIYWWLFCYLFAYLFCW